MTRPSSPPADLPSLALEASMAQFLKRHYASYLELVRQIESHPDNHCGADKSWVERAMWDYQQHYRKASRGS
jgi:hypothetical protein